MRGEIWTVAGGSSYTGKPRPAVIVQDNAFNATNSIVVCAFTTDVTRAEYLRVPIAPDGKNGLQEASSVMIDKVVSVPRDRLGQRIGELSAGDMSRVNLALLVFLGLARG